MTTELIDVSHYQTVTPSLVGKAGLFARAVYGTYADTMYDTHVANARKAGLVAGAYAFGRSGNVAGQVAAFLAQAGDADLFALDLERDGGNPSMSSAEAGDFIAKVKATGRKILLYHSESGFPSLGQDGNWVANWSQIPSIPWTFHQYRGSPLDLDRFNGTLAQLQALVHPPVIPKTWVAHVPAGRLYTRYTVAIVNGTRKIVGHHNYVTPNGFTLPCSGPRSVRRGTVPETRVQLVKITKPGASYDGIWISAGFAKEI